jgi:putative membrane protein
MIDWRHWHNEPFLIGGLVFLGWLWAILAGPLRTRLAAAGADGAGFPRAHAVRFYAGLLVFYLAVGSPLDQVAEGYLLSAHMLQHQLLIYPAAILFLLGIPHWMIDPWIGSGAPMKLARFASRPFVCGLVFLLVFGAWHAPLLYSAALENKVLHVFEHLLFFGSALLYWWPILSPSRVLPPASHGTQMLYLLAVIIGMMPIHAYITFSGDVLYPAYEFAPRLIDGFSAQDDQLLAGVSMQLVAMLVGLGTLGVAFYRWFLAGERDSGSGARSGQPRGVPVG